MAHSFTSLLTHIIFSTKDRASLLAPDFKPRLFDYMGGIIRGLDGASLLINGPEDHVHVLAKLPPTRALSNILRDLKADSSKWVTATLCRDFAWQTGYAAFSVSYSNAESVRNYIANQEDHHRRVSFRQEYLNFLERHGIEYDPRFVLEGEYVG